MTFYSAIRLMAVVASLGLTACSLKDLSGAPSIGEGGFVADGSRGQFNGETLSDPSTSKVKVGFTSLVRLRDPLSGERLPNGLEFETLVSETKEWPADVPGTPAEVNTDGDLRIQGSLEYQDLASETYYRRYLLVRSTSGPFQGAVRATEIYLNPWQRGDLFYRDAKLQGAPIYSVGTEQRPLLTLPAYTAVFIDRQFQVDSQLQLTALRRYALNLKPGLARPNPQGETQPKPLRPGTRLVLTAVLSDAIVSENHHPPFLSAFEVPVEVDAAGEINTTLVFSIGFTDQPRLDSRTRLNLSLRSLSEGVDPGHLSAAFVANPNGNDTTSGQAIAAEIPGSVPGIPHNVRAFPISGGTSYKTQVEWNGTPADLLAKYWKGYGPVVTVQVGEPPKPGWLDWQYWLQSHPASAKSFTSVSKLLEGNADSLSHHAAEILAPFCQRAPSLSAEERKTCQQTPGDFFHLAHFTLVDHVLNETPQIVAVNNPYLQLSAAYFNEVGLTHRTSEGDKTSDHSVSGVAAKIGYEILGSGASAQTAYNKEAEWYQVRESSVTDQVRSRVAVQEQVILSQEEIVLSLDLSLRHCVMVRPLRFLLAVAQKKSKPIPSYLFCSSTFDRHGVEESWFSIRDRWNAVHSAHSDPKDPQERGWTKLVRGKQAHSQFRQTISDSTRTYVFQKIAPFFDGIDSLASGAFYTPRQIERLNRDGGIFPGVLSHAASSSLKWSETQISRYSELCQKGFASRSKALEAEERGARYCRCFYESAARRWEHADYLKHSADYDRELSSSPAGSQCLAFAETEGDL